ncbi:hypothetical protein ACFLZ2_02480 [Candidatus Margulisiibacteriota bacterium]
MERNKTQQIEKQPQQLNAHCKLILDKLGKEKAAFEKPISEFFHKDLLNYINKLQTISASEKDNQALFDTLTDEIVAKGHSLEHRINGWAIMKNVKSHFRTLVGPWIYQGLIAKRAFEKPKGYPGDYQLLEIIYDNSPLTPKSNKIGYYSDVYFLKDELALGVRARKDQMSNFLIPYLQQANNSKIINFASGSAREIREILAEIPLTSKANMTLVDFDEDALAFSKNQLTKYNNIDFNFMKKDIISLSIKKDKISSLLDQDLVYSIGLIDYLPDRILKHFIQYCYSLLSPKGQIILSHKDQTKYTPLVQDWFCDWRFYERTKTSVLRIIEDAGIAKKSIKVLPLSRKSIYSIIINKE